MIRILVEECLTDAGFEVIEACSGEEAVEIMERADPFDLVLTDIHMPGSVDGNAVAAKAKQQYPGVPVIYASGRPDSLKNKLDRPDAFVRKPYSPYTLLTVVKLLLAGS